MTTWSFSAWDNEFDRIIDPVDVELWGDGTGFATRRGKDGDAIENVPLPCKKIDVYLSFSDLPLGADE